MFFDEDLEAQGANVVIRKKERYHERKVKGLYMPTDTDENQRCNTGVIESIGPLVEDDIHVGDEIVYDYYAAWADTHPIILTEVRNVIGIYTSENQKNESIVPIGNRLLLEPIVESDEDRGIIIFRAEADKKLEKCKVIGWGRGCTDKYALGDIVLVSNRQSTKVTVGKNDFRVISEDEVLAKVNVKK